MISLLAQETAGQEVVWSLVAPLVILSVGAVVLITITSVVPVLRGNGFPSAFTALVAMVAGGFLIPIWERVNAVTGTEGATLVIHGAIRVDGFSVFVTAVICGAVVLAALLLDDYLRTEGLDGPEWYTLLLLSASGGVILASAEDLIVTFVGLEVLSIAVYVLAALHLRRSESQEAGFKYFLLGALSSALFLYGIAMIYGATGSTSLAGIAQAGRNELGLDPRTESSLILAGMALLLVGFAFKVSAAPFHMWTPDVYQGAPTPVVAFMASGVKVAGFAGMVRVLWVGLGRYPFDWRPMLFVLAVLTLVVGALLAVVQTNVKRMLAYSSINHAGFILVAVYAASSDDVLAALLGGEALLFYLLAYSIMVAGTIGVVTIVAGRGDGRHELSDFRGLSRRSPILAGMMVVLLLAQAGVPFTSGFFAKFRVISAAAADQAYVLAGAAMLAAVVSAYLYLRIVVSMYMVPVEVEEPSVEAAPLTAPVPEPVSPALSAVLAVGLAAAATLALGLLPDLGGGVLFDAAQSLGALRSR
jgi:NADH-quinone oxidoreductase subunit N